MSTVLPVDMFSDIGPKSMFHHGQRSRELWHNYALRSVRPS